MTAKRPSSALKRSAAAEKAAPPAVSGRYTALSTRWTKSLAAAALGQSRGDILSESSKPSPTVRGQTAPGGKTAGVSKKSAAERKHTARSVAGAAARNAKLVAQGSFVSQAAPSNPYSMSPERVFEVLRKTKVLTPAGRLTKVFK